MGHYDNYLEGNCSICGQAEGDCEHTQKTRANDIQHGGQHYKGAKFQHWDLISKNGIGYLEGCATKYVSRWHKKNGLEDLNKAVHYIDKLMEMTEDHGVRPTGSASYSDLRLFFDENNINDRDEQLVIAHLCTWDSITCLQLARKHAVELLDRAQRAQSNAA